MSEREQTAGGAIGRLAGRAKEIAGAALGREDLHREGTLQQEQAEAEARVDAERTAAERAGEQALIESERAAIEGERREAGRQAQRIEAEEQAERERAGAETEAKRREFAETSA